jgi:hypothetical protein
MKQLIPPSDVTGWDGAEWEVPGQDLLDFVEWSAPRPQTLDRVLAFSAAYRVVQTERLGPVGGLGN